MSHAAQSMPMWAGRRSRRVPKIGACRSAKALLGARSYRRERVVSFARFVPDTDCVRSWRNW